MGVSRLIIVLVFHNYMRKQNGVSILATFCMLVVIAVVVLATVAFILAHSLQGSDASWAESNAAAALLEPVLRGLFGLVGEAAALFGPAAPLGYEAFVRKLAHFAEYSALGAECMAVTVVLTGRAVSPYVLVDLSAVLAVAAVDECLQALVGRTGMVADVLLDFSGGVAGVVLVLVVAGIVLRCRRGTATGSRVGHSK